MSRVRWFIFAAIHYSARHRHVTCAMIHICCHLLFSQISSCHVCDDSHLLPSVSQPDIIMSRVRWFTFAAIHYSAIHHVTGTMIHLCCHPLFSQTSSCHMCDDSHLLPSIIQPDIFMSHVRWFTFAAIHYSARHHVTCTMIHICCHPLFSQTSTCHVYDDSHLLSSII